MTKIELRILYLLNKYGGQARHSQLQQAMSRVDKDDRDAALSMLEDMHLLKSGKSPSKTRPSLSYWLTALGKLEVQEAIARGEIGESM